MHHNARKMRRENTYSLLLLESGSALGAGLLLRLALLEKRLRDEDLLLGRDGTTQNQISTRSGILKV